MAGYRWSVQRIKIPGVHLATLHYSAAFSSAPECCVVVCRSAKRAVFQRLLNILLVLPSPQFRFSAAKQIIMYIRL
jgi:hypothetical protein